ncbi:MAG: transcriptional regulator GcvA [Gammaproteobacteria bacterium]|jgi:LysR family glycine cleavage system transcriptional activator|nr:transcriptional regulator GcvA [Gammaproteobacteria bacterium]
MHSSLSKIPLSALRTFEAAARHLSFTKAARELHLTQGAVSQQMKHLEERLEFKLFRRHVRRLELTDEGRGLSAVVRNALYEIDETIRRLQAEDNEGVLTVSVGSAFAMNWLIPRLGQFRAQYPSIDVRIDAIDDALDLRTQRDIDMMIRFSRKNYPDLHVTELMREQVFVVCSPSLLDPRRPLRKPSDLCHYTLLHNEVSEREPDSAGDWNNWVQQLGEPVLPCLKEGPRFPRCDTLIQAALHGQGVALAWNTMVGNELSTGRLIKPLQGRFETANAFYAVSTPEVAQKPKTRKFREWLVAQARSEAERTDSPRSEPRANVR